MEQGTAAKATLAGGVLAALVASACCLGPLVLVSVGVGGAWMSNLSALEAWRPVLIGIALAFMALAFHRIFLKAPAEQACAVGAPCAAPASRRGHKVLFAIVAALVAFALGFPYLAPLFY